MTEEEILNYIREHPDLILKSQQLPTKKKRGRPKKNKLGDENIIKSEELIDEGNVARDILKENREAVRQPITKNKHLNKFSDKGLATADLAIDAKLLKNLKDEGPVRQPSKKIVLECIQCRRKYKVEYASAPISFAGNTPSFRCSRCCGA